MKAPGEGAPRDDAELDDLAAAWLCERAEGFAPERAGAYAAWLRSDPRHAAAVARVERALALLDEMPAVQEPLEQRFGVVSKAPEVEDAGKWPRRVIVFPRWALAAAAAAVVIVASVMGYVRYTQPMAREQHYAATAEAPRRVALEDGSVLELNARSAVRVLLSARERRVTLTTGEAHFAVAHDAARPFVVRAGGVAVRAVGTAFTVRMATGEVDVAVVEGRVAVSRVEDVATPATAPQLAAGERTRVASEPPSRVALAVPVEKLAPEAVRALLAWHDPMTTFIDVPLRDVVARFNRRNVMQLTLADAELGGRRIGGVIALDQVEAFVSLLAQDGDIAVEKRAGEIVLKRVR
ncbi:MAG TPA: FecR domain-containing protein [Opitutaceae bacterium]